MVYNGAERISIDGVMSVGNSLPTAINDAGSNPASSTYKGVNDES